MGPIFFEFRLKELLFKVGDRLLVQYQELGYVVVVCLLRSVCFFGRANEYQTYLFL